MHFLTWQSTLIHTLKGGTLQLFVKKSCFWVGGLSFCKCPGVPWGHSPAMPADKCKLLISQNSHVTQTFKNRFIHEFENCICLLVTSLHTILFILTTNRSHVKVASAYSQRSTNMFYIQPRKFAFQNCFLHFFA